MSISIDRFVSELERTARELPRVLNEWETLSEELRENYAEQLSWMITHADEVLQRLHATDQRETIERVQRALGSLATTAGATLRTIVAEQVVSPPRARVVETVTHLSEEAAQKLETHGEFPAADRPCPDNNC